MDPKVDSSSALEVGPVKMQRKVSFRDEDKKKPIADVILVPSYKHVNAEPNESCLKCELL